MSTQNLKLVSFAEAVRRGELRAIGRAITLVEDGRAEKLLQLLKPEIGTAFRIGITGPPGAGKSTLVDTLVRHLSHREKSIGVIAVDPSSPFSGGALLGDRVRMLRATEDKKVFVRSMATRGALGGLARSTQEAGDILDAAGKDIIIYETVGVGQSELTVASATDATVVVLVPESGGMVQALKAGLMEIADLFVVNKADRPGASEMEHQLIDASRYLITEGRRPPVLKVSALKEEGIEQLCDALQAFETWLQEGSRLEWKRRQQARTRLTEFIRQSLEEGFWSRPAVIAELEAESSAVFQGRASLEEAATRFWGRTESHRATLERGTGGKNA